MLIARILVITSASLMLLHADENSTKKSQAPSKSAGTVVAPPGFGQKAGAARPEQAPPKPAAKTQSAEKKAASKKSQGRGTSTPAKPAHKAVPPEKVPEGAKMIEPNTYRYTDAAGKTWIYRETPFGVRKLEEGAQPATQAEAQSHDGTIVVEQGDSLRFERKTPFGTRSWTKKKSDLTDSEMALWKTQGGQK